MSGVASPATDRSEKLASLFVGIVGREHTEQAAEASGSLEPAITISPGNIEEVAAALRVASEHHVFVTPAGAQLHQHLGNIPPHIDVLLSTARLNHVEHYDPGDLTIGVGAGTTLAAIDGLLAPHRQFLPVNTLPANSRADRATLGGVLATAMQGPLRHGYGGVRDFCIGIQFVAGDGTRGHGGGRVVKNVAGYDLMKLLIGSFGTLGVITSANFKLFPRPQQTRTFVCRFSSAAHAVAFRDRMLASQLSPMCLEVVSPAAAEELHGAGTPSGWRVLLRAAGSEAVLGRYRRELGHDVTNEFEALDEADAWRLIADFESIVVANNFGVMTIAISLPISAAAQGISAAERVAQGSGFRLAMIGRFGVGALIAAFIPSDPAVNYGSVVNGLRAALPARASSTVRHCPAEVRQQIAIWDSPTVDLECMKLVRHALDPAGILNRGRYVV
jgi:glycolate oxidase FAD binding subunit